MRKITGSVNLPTHEMEAWANADDKPDEGDAGDACD
jgi:hypothetical protein